MTDPKSNEAAKTGKAEPLPEAKEAAAALPAPDSAEPLAAARKEAADNYERYVRAAADLENFRRRSIREKEDLRLYAASKVLEELLPVLDNLARGVSAAKQPDPDLKAVTGGVDMALQQFKSVLAGHGLIEINPLGQPFDPHRHEAISHQPSADIPAEHVANVVRAGYLLNGRLLRPAAVVVSSGSPAKR